MQILHKDIHVRSIVGSVGLMMHVPAIMALFTSFVALINREWSCLLPFSITGVITLAIGRFLYLFFYGKEDMQLWDAMIIAALSWLICPILAAIPMHFTLITLPATMQNSLVVQLGTFSNSLFEAFSGFTSTGLTMVSTPSALPNTILWWRSFMQWVGGIGLIVFMISLIDFHRTAYNLYYAEARTEKIGGTIKQTARLIWAIYFALTLLVFIVLWSLGMQVFEAINHAMCGISTGGFVIVDGGIAIYSAPIKIALIVTMIIGSMSFAMHYHCIKAKSVASIWRDKEHRFFLLLLLIGSIFVALLLQWHSNSMKLLSVIFEWVSAFATCGYSTIPIFSINYTFQLVFIFAMLVGGCVGSTAGGLKVHRFLQVFSGIWIRLKSVFSSEESKELEEYGSSLDKKEEPSGLIVHGERNVKRLYSANVFFSLWLFIIFISWVVLSIANKEAKPIALLFDIFSAMSNVGLTAGTISIDMGTFPKYYYMFLMWLGRLEIVPVVILLLSMFSTRKVKA